MILFRKKVRINKKIFSWLIHEIKIFSCTFRNWKPFFKWLSSFCENWVWISLVKFRKFTLHPTLRNCPEAPEWPKILKLRESFYFYISFKTRPLWIISEQLFKNHTDCRKIFKIDQCELANLLNISGINLPLFPPFDNT